MTPQQSGGRNPIAVVILNYNGKAHLEKFLPGVVQFSPGAKGLGGFGAEFGTEQLAILLVRGTELEYRRFSF